MQTRPEQPDQEKDRNRGIIVVSGIPGAGKSTLSSRLACEFSRGVHIEADQLHRMIKRGGRWPDEDPLTEGAAQLRLRGRNCCLLARSFYDAGFVAVIDDIVIGDRFDHYSEDLEAYPWSMVQLLPSLAIVRARHLGRTAATVADQWPHLDQLARSTPHGLQVDTSALSPEQTVSAVLADVWGSGCITGPL